MRHSDEWFERSKRALAAAEKELHRSHTEQEIADADAFLHSKQHETQGSLPLPAARNQTAE